MKILLYKIKKLITYLGIPKYLYTSNDNIIMVMSKQI